MSRKPKKGYFVRGQFVAEGSELDLALKAELKGTPDQSRTDMKRESTALQHLGEQLMVLGGERFAALALPEKLVDAIAQAKRITHFEGKRRQMQYVGKLMRALDAATLDAVRAALDAQHHGSAQDTLALHLAETWRDRLIADDASAAQWLQEHPATDAQQLRSLIRQARKDAVALAQLRPPAAAAPRQGRAYRDIFQLVRDHLSHDTA